jgi:hypothetical protein
MTKINKYCDVLDRLQAIFLSKNALYGDSTTDTFNKFGAISYAIRLNDKLRRFQSLVAKQDGLDGADNESMIDTLLDMANYAILAVVDIESAK